jgi:hypothetical protein
MRLDPGTLIMSFFFTFKLPTLSLLSVGYMTVTGGLLGKLLPFYEPSILITTIAGLLYFGIRSGNGEVSGLTWKSSHGSRGLFRPSSDRIRFSLGLSCFWIRRGEDS